MKPLKRYEPKKKEDEKTIEKKEKKIEASEAVYLSLAFSLKAYWTVRSLNNVRLSLYTRFWRHSTLPLNNDN